MALDALCEWLNSDEAAAQIHELRPTVRLRDSFPKIAAKDLAALVDKNACELRRRVAA